MSLRGRTAVLTGGGRGIGRATSQNTDVVGWSGPEGPAVISVYGGFEV